jgi:NAD(P) transhydrogenase subunit beta
MLITISQLIIGSVDLLAAFLLMFGLWRMASPVTAPSGILVAGVGMLVAVAASFLYVFTVKEAARPHLPLNIALSAGALIIGVGVAWWSGRKVSITAMPQAVALFNGMGGGAAAAIAAVELFGLETHGATLLTVTLLGALIGSISLSGSIIAWAKLDSLLEKPLHVPGLQWFNGAVLLAGLLVGGYVVFVAAAAATPVIAMPHLIEIFFGIALLYGILMTLPIGGADMPVVISVYNAFTGLAVGLEGYVLENPALMIAGMLVGAAGLLLTLLMAEGMNRSVGKILFSSFGPGPKRKQGAIKGSLKPVQASDAGIFMRYAKSVIICPGYGLAVSQGQGKLYDFVKLLQAAGVSVKFAIHPVAGRMPGPYDLIVQLADVNEDFKTADVALVIGANDTVNPDARNDKTSPIYGMPILNADQAAKCYCIKRGSGKGYAGIVNPLFYADKTDMVYGDAAAVCVAMAEAVRGLGAPAAAA